MTPARDGFSLLEVLLATALLMGSAIVLAELANIGRAHARSAEELAAAQLICQTKLNEMLSGATAVDDIEDQRLAELPGWVLSVDTRSVELPDLVQLRVTVAEADDDDRPRRRRKTFTLVRWIRKPGNESQGQSRFVTESWSDLHPEEGSSP